MYELQVRQEGVVVVLEEDGLAIGDVQGGALGQFDLVEGGFLGQDLVDVWVQERVGGQEGLAQGALYRRLELLLWSARQTAQVLVSIGARGCVADRWVNIAHPSIQGRVSRRGSKVGQEDYYGDSWCEVGTDSFLNILTGALEALVVPGPIVGQKYSVGSVRRVTLPMLLLAARNAPRKRSRGD